MTPIEIIKRNILGEIKFRYGGRIYFETPEYTVIEAFFNRDDMLFNGMLMRKDDRFLEVYFREKWYNIYEVHDKDDDSIKGWYCNISFPASFFPATIEFIDLELDLMALPDRSILILDREEFNALKLHSQEKELALAALQELEDLFGSDQGFSIETLLAGNKGSFLELEQSE